MGLHNQSWFVYALLLKEYDQSLPTFSSRSLLETTAKCNLGMPKFSFPFLEIVTIVLFVCLFVFLRKVALGLAILAMDIPSLPD